MSEQLNTPSEIARLNDAFRAQGNFLWSAGTAALDSWDGLREAVMTFDDFNADNDPHLEHDGAMLEWEGESVYWKIDYTDGDEGYWVDPLSPDCVRVLTVMFGSEY